MKGNLLIEQFVKDIQPKTVIDVGCICPGFIPLWLRCGAEHIHIFEPYPQNYQELIEYYKAKPEVYIHQLALDERTYYMEETYIYNTWTLQSRTFDGLELSPDRTHNFGTHFIRLDAMSLAPDFIKVDTDGMEPHVLRGARQTLKHTPPMMIELSDLPVAFDEPPTSTIDLLLDLGYLIYTDVRDGHTHKLESARSIFPLHTSFDILVR